MKKIILIMLMISCSVKLFGYYASENFIDFLVHSNQVRVRTDRLGVLAGPSNVRVAVGLTSANSLADFIIDNLENSKLTNAVWRFTPSVLAGVGYDSDLFGIGVGYEYTWKNDSYMIHTPVITATALNDSFRINIPVSIGLGYKSSLVDTDLRGTRVISTAVEARYYFPKEMPVLNHLRFYFNYGNAYVKNVRDNAQYFEQSSLGIQARIYFKIETPDVLIEPILRVQYDQSLATKYNLADGLYSIDRIRDNFAITAKGFTPYWPTIGPGTPSGAQGDPSANGQLQGGYLSPLPGGYYAVEPYRVGVAIPVGFTAASLDENIHFYLEPALSFTMIGGKHLYQSGFENSPERKTPFMALGYVVYGELYIRPVKSLEWYFELQTGGVTIADSLKNAGSTELVLNGATGITYYF
ncbi:serpulina hyodysenteriae variable surface protein [Brachyspira pilosicoli WesB]|uniref:Serpulina hyodysenteriae variable surface protein n=1 Tax=Brachyspira pilosicoli WesB TaxID=1161918 RepID=K0JMQ5_BRAPL|nr:variable surface family protein [Brachyspira pilosicoli]CCG57706.1 serpulina hyodysenteriae variable surface protein [Brachyspira pilosicoli WesB]